MTEVSLYTRFSDGMKLVMAATTSSQKTLRESDLAGWSLLERFLAVLDSCQGQNPPGKRECHGLRTLERRSYLGLFLLGLFNPVVTSMRGLCAATQLPRVRSLIGRDNPVGLSRFSDAQHVFSPDILRPVWRRLLEHSALREVIGTKFGARLTPALIRIVDSTVWKVVPRMRWAHWRGLRGQQQKAVRLHVKLRLADLQPDTATVTSGKRCERAVMREHLAAGEFYIGDRYYGEDYALFEQLQQRGCGFLIRLRNEAVIHVIERHTINAEAAAQGVRLDAQVELGCQKRRGPWRVVAFQKPGMKQEIIVVTSEPAGTLSALEIVELYRHRWQVEMFFRWLKCLVPCRHWLAQSQQGVTLQVYLALIEALLLAELTGRKPGRRLMELCQWHAQGWASDADLAAGIQREQQKQARLSAKQKEA